MLAYVEEKVPGIKALSFVDDVAWTAAGEEENELSETLERAAAAAQEWANTTFDTDKTEAILLSRRRKHKPTAPPPRGIQVGETTVHFNKQATRWLGVWLDSQLTLKVSEYGVRKAEAEG